MLSTESLAMGVVLATHWEKLKHPRHDGGSHHFY